MSSLQWLLIPTPGDQPEPQEGGGIGLEGNKPLSFFVLHVHPHACTYVVGVNEGDVFATGNTGFTEFFLNEVL